MFFTGDGGFVCGAGSVGRHSELDLLVDEAALRKTCLPSQIT
jgi:hypothetical protein